MAQTTAQHEPSMEEILASIRKIISEDSQPARARAEAPQAEAEEMDQDVLELTEEVGEERAAAPAQDDEVVFEDVEEAGVEEEAMVETADTDEIFSERARAAIGDTLGAVEAETPAPSPAPRGHTVELVFERAVRESFEPVLRGWLDTHAPQLVDRMKPLIREWMDENFPEMLEAAVRKELARRRRATRR